MGGFGSPEYALRWNELATPLGPPILQRQALPRRTSDSGCSGWPSPTMADGASTRNATATRHVIPPTGIHAGTTLTDAATFAGWPSPDTGRDESLETFLARQERMKVRHPDKGMGTPLGIIAQMAGWGTPSARDHKDSGPAFEADPLIVPTESRLARQAAALAGWATPKNTDGDNGLRSPEGAAAEFQRKGTGADLPTFATLAHGPTATPSPASTPGPTAPRSTGVLDAAFSRWLMGFPASWDEASPGWREWCAVQGRIASGGCAGTATP